MARIAWDQVGQRRFESGVDHGVFYPLSGSGVPWNGLVSVNEQPVSGEPVSYYVDGVKFLSSPPSEEFSATIEAFTYPDEFEEASTYRGMTVGEQPSTTFGLVYRTKVGDDLEGQDRGYKIHLIYNAMATPVTRSNVTLEGSPQALLFSWKLDTTQSYIPGYKPTSRLTIDSTKAFISHMKILEDHLYGTASTEPYLPSPTFVRNLINSEPEGYGEQPYGKAPYGGRF